MARNRTRPPGHTQGRSPGLPRRRPAAQPAAGVPSVRDPRTLATAARLDPERAGRMEALASYLDALPADVDSLGGLRSCLREDARLLFEAVLVLRAQGHRQHPPARRARRARKGRGQR